MVTLVVAMKTLAKVLDHVSVNAKQMTSIYVLIRAVYTAYKVNFSSLEFTKSVRFSERPAGGES